MNSSVISLLVGTVLGFLSGLGIGGGSLLVLWLTVVLSMDPVTARGVNLLFFLPSAVISLVTRPGKVPVRKLLPVLAAGCLAAGVCAYLANYLDTEILKKGFGVLLIAAGCRELARKKQ